MKPMNTLRWLSQKMSRTDRRVANNIGKIKIPMPQGASKMFRDFCLEEYDAYFESRQYDHLTPWENSTGATGGYVPISERSPKLKYPFGKLLCTRLTSRLVGDDVFPSFTVEDDPDTTEYLRYIMKASWLKSRIQMPIIRNLAAGSVFVRFYISEGQFVVEHYLSKYCYPTLSAAGVLKAMTIKYVYCDEEDKDEKGNPKKKWFKMDLGEYADVLYDNPEFKADEDPVFFPISQVDHNMGFVQGEWFRTAELQKTPDGYSLLHDIRDFIDDFSYSLSQSSMAVSYNQDPQLWFKNMDQEELDNLIRSSTKSWNLGRDGETGFLESGMNGVTTAMELRDKMRTSIVDVTRIVLMDPEKMAASAQSGKALEILHGPMVELVKELRPMVEKGLQSLILKMAMANLLLAQRGEPVPVQIPQGYSPLSLNITVTWPPVFPMTMADLKEKVSVVQAATSSNLISRETGTRYIAKDFGVEDIEVELQKVNTQPVLNPFGGF